MIRELAENNFLKDFGQEGEVWHWSVVFFCFFFKISGLRVVFLRRGLTIADFKADGKRPECRESLMIDVRCGRRSSRQWVRKDAGRGSSPQVFIVDWFSIFFTLSWETDWKAPQTVPQKGWWGTEGGVTVVDSRLRRMKVTSMWKKSEKRCGSSERGTDCWWPEYLQWARLHIFQVTWTPQDSYIPSCLDCSKTYGHIAMAWAFVGVSVCADTLT